MHCLSFFMTILLIDYSNGFGYYDYKEKPGTMRIELARQKTPRQQYLEHEELLTQYGYNLDWLHLSSKQRTNDSIALYRYLDNEFYGKIVIGHPGKTMNVAFDTAWDLSWVLSSRCNTNQIPGCKNHNLYDHDGSSYYVKNGTKYFGDEGQFNFTGFYSYENISMAHSNVTGFLFVEMVIVPDSIQFNKADGVLGLGLRDGDYEPFFYTLYRQKKIRDPIFSIYLNRDRNSNRGGNIMLGFVDSKHIHKTQLKNKTIVPDHITYLRVDPGEYWKFSVDKMLFTKDPKHVYSFCESGCKAIADTSSSQIIGPSDDVDKIHDVIHAYEKDGKWIVDCDKVNQMPKFDIFLGGTRFRLGGKQYIMKESNVTITTCVSAFTPSTTSVTNGLWVLGGAFLSQFYSIYNINDKTIGFVRAA